MAKFTLSPRAVFLFTLFALAATPARANLFSLQSSGTISFNSSGDSTIPADTPWSFELVYDTAAPDLDTEFGGPPDPTFGVFANTSAPPAMTFFHYKAGSYEVTLDDPTDFGTFSNIHITFTTVNAIDINISAPTLFPHLAGGAVSFHADFNAFSPTPIFSSDALPTNTAISPASFGESAVTLQPTSGVITGSTITTFTIIPVPPGDYNFDGTVNAADYTLWRDTLGSTTDLQANGDNTAASANVIDQADYLFWQSHFGIAGSGAGGAANTAVPEPSTLLLAIVTLAACGLTRRKK
jgi:PEP-CTERM motif-containing protein